MLYVQVDLGEEAVVRGEKIWHDISKVCLFSILLVAALSCYLVFRVLNGPGVCCWI
jgi:hypothetical protein